MCVFCAGSQLAGRKDSGEKERREMTGCLGLIR